MRDVTTYWDTGTREQNYQLALRHHWDTEVGHYWYTLRIVYAGLYRHSLFALGPLLYRCQPSAVRQRAIRVLSLCVH